MASMPNIARDRLLSHPLGLIVPCVGTSSPNAWDVSSSVFLYMTICILPYVTLKGSPFNSRGSVRPADRTTRGTSTLKGAPLCSDRRAAHELGDPHSCVPIPAYAPTRSLSVASQQSWSARATLARSNLFACPSKNP